MLVRCARWRGITRSRAADLSEDGELGEKIRKEVEAYRTANGLAMAMMVAVVGIFSIIGNIEKTLSQNGNKQPCEAAPLRIQI